MLSSSTRRLVVLTEGIALLCAVALLAGLVLGPVIAVARPEMLAGWLPDLPLASPPSPGRLTATFLAGALALPAQALALVWLARLFRSYRQRDIFGPVPTGQFHRIGLALFAAALLGILATPLQSVILTGANPPGQRMVTLGISGSTFSVILIALAVTVIGRVMAEAARLKAENEGFV